MRIEVEGITKKYRNKQALDNVSFQLNEPKIYGLLGRNGAGKTTFMNMLAGYQLPSAGSIRIDGEDPFDNRKILKQMCLIEEGNNFYKDMRVKEVLQSYEHFYPQWDASLANSLIDEYRLPLKPRVKTLSKGMVSALGIIVGLASQAPITIFDEPYIGLDAAGRKKFYEILVDEYEENPRTFIFSTHLIDEVSLLFEEVLILQDGRLILQENAETMRQQAFSVSGEIAEVQAYIEDKQVIKTKQLAHVMTAYVYGEKQHSDTKSLTFEGVPIQDLMIYLTEENMEVRACS